jgi:hypothetical protein
VVAATLPTRRTNGAKHCVRLWKKRLPLKTNLKELERRCLKISETYALKALTPVPTPDKSRNRKLEIHMDGFRVNQDFGTKIHFCLRMG